MGLFGKKGEGEEDSSRLALFGSRNKSKSPAPPPNPYASIPPDPYTQAKMSAGIVPPPQPPAGQQPPQGGYGNRNGPPPQQQSYGGSQGYGQSPSGYGRPQDTNAGYGRPQDTNGGYGPGRFGNEQGYGRGTNGSNPYAGYSQTSGTSRQGGYGGLGKADDDDPALEENRDALFGGAKQRIQEKQQSGPPGGAYNPAADPNESRSYGAYGDRQLTAEEEEEEDIEATKQEIKFMKQQDVSSSRNALRMAAMAEETGRNTLARLGAQGERLHNTNRNLDIANNSINIAEDKARELKTLNRSMFAVHVNNPFTTKERRIQREEKIMNQHEAEREQREATREAAFKANQRMNQNFKTLGDSQNTSSTYKPNLAERAKYQFEADSDDERMEDEIDRNIDELSGAAKRLNMLARATGEEVDSQNKIIRGIAEKSDSVDSRVHLQTERLKRIK